MSRFISYVSTHLCCQSFVFYMCAWAAKQCCGLPTHEGLRLLLHVRPSRKKKKKMFSKICDAACAPTIGGIDRRNKLKETGTGLNIVFMKMIQSMSQIQGLNFMHTYDVVVLVKF